MIYTIYLILYIQFYIYTIHSIQYTNICSKNNLVIWFFKLQERNDAKCPILKNTVNPFKKTYSQKEKVKIRTQLNAELTPLQNPLFNASSEAIKISEMRKTFSRHGSSLVPQFDFWAFRRCKSMGLRGVTEFCGSLTQSLTSPVPHMVGYSQAHLNCFNSNYEGHLFHFLILILKLLLLLFIFLLKSQLWFL